MAIHNKFSEISQCCFGKFPVLLVHLSDTNESGVLLTQQSWAIATILKVFIIVQRGLLNKSIFSFPTITED